MRFWSMLHEKSHSINMWAQLSSGIRCLKFDQNFYLSSYFVCVSSKVSGKAVHLP